MKMRLAKTAGFCMGVRRAVEMVLDIQRYAPPRPIVTYGPLIHNPQTLQLLESRGIRQINFPDEIVGGTVIVRAHGITPQERLLLKERALRIVDATCPRVARVQSIIRKHSLRGEFCIIVGDADHPEVKGLVGFGSAGAIAIPSVRARTMLAAIPGDRAICVVAQTTQEIDTFNSVVQLIKDQYKTVEIYNTICDSTSKRQSEVVQLAKSVDMIVVVGGKGSGNTRRLVKVAEAQGVAAIHVEKDEELVPSEFTDVETVGVTAGASTPNWQILSVIDKIKEIGMSRQSVLLAILHRAADTVVMTYLWAALAGGGLTAACMVAQGIPLSILPIAVTMLFVFSMHLLNRIQDTSGAVRFNTPQIAAFFASHSSLLTSAAALSSISTIVLGYWMGRWAQFLLVFMVITGGLYTTPLVPRTTSPKLKWKSLKDLPGSKTPLVAAGWAMSAAVVPVIGSETPLSFPGLVVSFIVAAGLVFWRTALSDLLDIQGDRIVGRETIPILLGVQRTARLLLSLLLFMAILLGASAAMGWVTSFGYLIIVNTVIFAVFFLAYKRRPPVDRLWFEAMIDGNLILAGVIAVLAESSRLKILLTGFSS